MVYCMDMKNSNIFDEFEYLSSPNLSEMAKQCDTKIFFLFISCLRNIPNGDWITLDTITDQEEKIIQNNLSIFVSNFMSCDSIIFDLIERDSLSGLVLFRLEILPIFSLYINPDFDWIPMMLRLCHWEQHCKRRILDGIEAGNDKMKANNMPPTTDEVREQHRWWNNDYKESDDRIHLLNDEYNLTD